MHTNLESRFRHSSINHPFENGIKILVKEQVKSPFLYQNRDNKNFDQNSKLSLKLFLVSKQVLDQNFNLLSYYFAERSNSFRLYILYHD